MHLGVIEAVLHDAPAFIEDLLPFHAMIYFNPGGEIHPAAFKVASSSSGCGSARSSTGSAGGRAKINRIESFAFHEVNTASIFGELQRIDVASSLRPATALFIVLPPAAGGNGCNLQAIFRNGVERAHRTAITIGNRHERIQSAVGRNCDCGDVVTEVRHLMRAAGDAVKIDFHVGFGRLATGLRIALAVKPFRGLGLLFVVHTMVPGVLLFFCQRYAIELHKALPQIGIACLCQARQEEQPLAIGCPLRRDLAEENIIVAYVMFAATGGRYNVNVRTQITIQLRIRNPLSIRREVRALNARLTAGND